MQTQSVVKTGVGLNGSLSAGERNKTGEIPAPLFVKSGADAPQLGGDANVARPFGRSCFLDGFFIKL
jgi:hypothetical protein